MARVLRVQGIATPPVVPDVARTIAAVGEHASAQRVAAAERTRASTDEIAASAQAPARRTRRRSWAASG